MWEYQNGEMERRYGSVLKQQVWGDAVRTRRGVRRPWGKQGHGGVWPRVRERLHQTRDKR